MVEQDKWTMNMSGYTQPLATFNTQWDVTFSPTFDKLIHVCDDGKTLTTNVTELIGLLRARPADLVTAREERIAARARIAELEAAQKWQPIKSAPFDIEVLAYCSKQKRWHVAKLDRDFGWIETTECGFISPIAWLPLPAPPKEGGK